MSWSRNHYPSWLAFGAIRCGSLPEKLSIVQVRIHHSQGQKSLRRQDTAKPLISVHAPHDENNDLEKDKLWDSLGQVIRKRLADNYALNCLLIDANATTLPDLLQRSLVNAGQRQEQISTLGYVDLVRTRIPHICVYLTLSCHVMSCDVVVNDTLAAGSDRDHDAVRLAISRPLLLAYAVRSIRTHEVATRIG